MSTIEWLDDSEWSIDPEDEPTRLWLPLTGLIVGILVLVGAWVYRYETRPAPPVVTREQYCECAPSSGPMVPCQCFYLPGR